MFGICPEPIGGEITIAWESSWIDKAPQSDMERRLVEQLRERKFAKNAPVQSERRGCYYTSIPASVKHKNISGGDLTALNLDKVMFLSFVVHPYAHRVPNYSSLQLRFKKVEVV